MADRFWVGGTGTWDFAGTTHWSTTSGGAAGASAPYGDNVFFDANSFSGDGQTVTVSGGGGFINNFDASAITYTVTISISSGSVIATYGPTVILSDKLTLAASGTGEFQMNCLTASTFTPSNATITSGLTFGMGGDGYFTLQGDIVTTKRVVLNSGTFYANNYDITALYFWCPADATYTTLYMGSGTWTITGAVGFWIENSPIVPTINAETSTLYTSIIDSDMDLTFYNLRAYGSSLNMGSAQNITCTDATFTSGQTITFKSGKTFTATTLIANGSSGSLITFTTSAGTTTTLNATSASVSYINVRRNVAAGDIPFQNVPGGVDTGSNTNWCFPGTCGNLPEQNTSLISAVVRVEQNLPYPRFVIGGRNASTYKLFKNATSYTTLSVWRSKVYTIGTDFDVQSITLPLITDLDASTEIIPKLYFDDESDSSVGTTINNTNYSNTNKLITLTAQNFNNQLHGKSNFFFELQFTGSSLATVGFPITINVDIKES